MRLRGLAGLAVRLGRMELGSSGGRFDRALLRRRLLSSRRTLYPVDAHPIECFLNDFEIEGPLAWVNPPAWRRRLRDKLVVHDLLSRRAPEVRMPTVRGCVADGRPLFLPDGDRPRGPLIAKPACGSGGRGVLRLEEGQALPPTGFHLLEEPVEPHPYAAAIFPHALNTVRVLMGRSPEGAAPILLGAAHRFGTSRSAPKDNFKSGGVVAHVDPASGVLSGVLVHGPGRARVVLDHHPETGARVEGKAIPEWPAMLATARRCADAFPWLVYAGFDIALAPDGPVLIEINVSLPNPNLIQMHRPLLADPEARRFFLSVGVISPKRSRQAEAAALHRPRP